MNLIRFETTPEALFFYIFHKIYENPCLRLVLDNFQLAHS